MVNKNGYRPIPDSTYIVVFGGNDVANVFENVGHGTALLLICFAGQFSDTLFGLICVFHCCRCVAVAGAACACAVCIDAGVSAQLQCTWRLGTSQA